MQILHDFVTTGGIDDLDLWHEWEDGARGRRQITWSRGLKAALGIDAISDEHAAEEADEDVNARILGDQVVTDIPSEQWREIVSLELEWTLLGVAEAASLPALELQDWIGSIVVGLGQEKPR